MLISIITCASVVVLFLSCSNIQIDFWTLEHELPEDRGYNLLRTFALFVSLSLVPGEMFGKDKAIHNIHHIR